MSPDAEFPFLPHASAKIKTTRLSSEITGLQTNIAVRFYFTDSTT